MWFDMWHTSVRMLLNEFIPLFKKRGMITKLRNLKNDIYIKRLIVLKIFSMIEV